MKNILIIFILILGLQISTKAQKLEAEVFLQQTVMGLQKGYSVKTVSDFGLRYGVFFQSNNHFSFKEGQSNYPYAGIDLSYPISKCGKVKLYANLKSGLVDYKFLAVSPEIESNIDITRFLSIGVGSGLRARKAAVSCKVIIKPF